MGVGPSNLVVMQADADLRELEWKEIEEELAFFHRWDMDDVTSAVSRFEGASADHADINSSRATD